MDQWYEVELQMADGSWWLWSDDGEPRQYDCISDARHDLGLQAVLETPRAILVREDGHREMVC